MRKLFPLLLLLSLPAWASWTVVQSKQGTISASPSSVTFSSSLTNPSTIIVLCRMAVIDALGVTVTDTAGNTFSDAGFGTFQFGVTPRDTFQIFTAANTHTTASDVVSCNLTSSNQVGIVATEATGGSICYDGGAGTANQNTTGGGANAIVFNGFTTTTNGDLVYVAYDDAGGSSAWTAGTSPVMFTLMPDTPTTDVGEYVVQGTHGTIAPTMGYTGGAVNWGGLTIALKASCASASATQIGAFIVGP